jgi:hypothetical protein
MLSVQQLLYLNLLQQSLLDAIVRLRLKMFRMIVCILIPILLS